jgi:hypothetical protein
MVTSEAESNTIACAEASRNEQVSPVKPRSNSAPSLDAAPSSSRQPMPRQSSESQGDLSSNPQANLTSSSEQADEEVHTQKRTSPNARRRLGGYTTFLLIVTSLLLLGSMAFISFLWWSKRTNTTWRKIMLADWATRSVSLSALALRTAISLQAAVATSILASYLLECHGVTLPNLAFISVTRVVNTGPWGLFFTLSKRLGHSTHFVIYLSILLLLCITFAAQFSSTILLSDLALAMVSDFRRNATVEYGFPPNVDYLGFEPGMQSDYRTITPVYFPLFAEYQQAGQTENRSTDTGITVRSFLPISVAEDRENLGQYDGPALVYDARVFCTTPLISEIQIETYPWDDGGPNRLVGIVTPAYTLPELVWNSTGVSFNCTSSPVELLPDLPPEVLASLPPAAMTASGDSTWTVCALNASAGGLIPTLDPTNNSTLPHKWIVGNRNVSGSAGNWIASNGRSWPVDVGNAYLVLNYSSNTGQSLDNVTAQWTFQNASGPFIEAMGHDILGNFTYKFHAAMCFDAM